MLRNLLDDSAKVLEGVKAGDTVCVDWCDASTGKGSMNGGSIDVSVRSVGIFLGVLEGKHHIRYILLVNNSFKFAESDFDLDYTSIPLSWGIEVKVLDAGSVEPVIADQMMASFCKTQVEQATAGKKYARMFNHRMQRLRHE